MIWILRHKEDKKFSRNSELVNIEPGFSPSWAPQPGQAIRPLNRRSDSIHTYPSFLEIHSDSKLGLSPQKDPYMESTTELRFGENIRQWMVVYIEKKQTCLSFCSLYWGKETESIRENVCTTSNWNLRHSVNIPHSFSVLSFFIYLLFFGDFM